jgi:hypothetical protein
MTPDLSLCRYLMLVAQNRFRFRRITLEDYPIGWPAAALMPTDDRTIQSLLAS